MRYFPKLKSDRIYLSPVNLEDCETYVRWINDSRVSDGLGNSWDLYDMEKERAFLTGMAKNTDYHFAIVKNDGDVLLGNVSLFNLHQVNRTADFGIFIGDEANRGMGYGIEAGRLILTHAFDTLNLRNVMLRVFSFNTAAIACYEKLGFKKIGVRREAYFVGGRYHDDVYMDVLREEFYAGAAGR